LRPATRRAWLALCLLLGCVQLVCRVPLAAAQSDVDATRDASARTFFEEGVRMAEQGNWVDAEDRFRRALTLRSSPVIAYNLASALVERGKLVEASETVRRVLADENVDPQLKQSAARMSTDLQQRISHLTVDVSGWQPGDSALLDGNALLEAQLRIEIPIDPGSHQLRIERAGNTAAWQSITLAPGERQQVILVARALAPSATSLAQGTHTVQPTAAQSSTADAHPSVFGRWWFWTGAAAVVGAGVVVAVLAAQGGSAASERPYQGNVPPGSIRVEVMGK
jgi:hypothetical protein